MSEWKHMPEFYDPDAVTKDADVTIKASELTRLKALLAECGEVLNEFYKWL